MPLIVAEARRARLDARTPAADGKGDAAATRPETARLPVANILHTWLALSVTALMPTVATWLWLRPEPGTRQAIGAADRDEP